MTPPPDSSATPVAPLMPEAPYAFNARALTRWSRTKLTVEREENGGVRACFHYEGSVCCNMGHPLFYDFFVHLAPPSENYTILDVSCAPAPDDLGYKKMCKYIENPEKFLAKVDSEKPLVGQPLDDAIAWNPNKIPAGCLCSRTMRDHKWSVVLQTLHFKLANEQQ